MREMTPEKKVLARALFNEGVFLDKSRSPDGAGFPLRLHDTDPDAPLSPYYLNLRTSGNTKPGPLEGTLLDMLGRALFNEAERQRLRYRSVAGLPTAGTSLAQSFHLFCVTECTDNPAVLINMKKRKSGDFRIITPIPSRASSLLLIDDVVTGAGSVYKALHTFKPSGVFINECLVVVDREQGGVEKLKRQGIYVHSLFTITELVNFYLDEGLLKEEQAKEILSYVHEN
ncbi:hypothetical protein CL630_00495 [bacterium]|nr:hypothetical protein [bacterium]|tara:strand:- start:37014 stop:37700 length:687 start_codon:yes stop_codon:yes gene_type:complete